SDGGRGVYPPGSTWFFPGAEGTTDNYGAVRFTVPADGSGGYDVRVTVKPYLNSGSGDTDFHVLKNGVELFGQFMPGDSGPVSFAQVLPLAAGDRIDFVIG